MSVSKLRALAYFFEERKDQKNFSHQELMQLWGLVCALFSDKDFSVFVRNVKRSMTKVAKETPTIVDGEFNADALNMYMFGYKSRKFIDNLQEKFRGPLDIIRDSIGENFGNAEIPDGYVVDYREEEIPEHVRSAHKRRILKISFE